MPVKGQIRIVAQSREEAEELAGYLWRATGSAAWFYRPKAGREGEWLVYGEVELPPGEQGQISDYLNKEQTT